METSRESLDASALLGSGGETEPGEPARDYTRGAIRQLHEEDSRGTVRTLGRERVNGGHDRREGCRCGIGSHDGWHGAHQSARRAASAADTAFVLVGRTDLGLRRNARLASNWRVCVGARMLMGHCGFKATVHMAGCGCKVRRSRGDSAMVLRPTERHGRSRNTLSGNREHQ